MKNEIIILTANDGYFGQSLLPWESIDLNKIIKLLKNKYSIDTITYDKVQFIDISNKYIIYTSTQEPNLKGYYEDLLFYLLQKGNILIPNFNIFKSHDNKGFQELQKKLLSIQSIDTKYYASHELSNKNIKYPIVFKLPDGAASTGVTLISNGGSLKKKLKQTKRNLYNINMLKNIFKQYIKKYFLLKNISEKNFEYFRPKTPFILQDFVSGLTYDFKVLVFWNKFYVLKRYIRNNDFRASGSGNFKYEPVEKKLLDYAEKIFKKFDVPFISLDICYANEQYYLIEFQGIHFGPYTLMFSESYYTRDNNDWICVKEKSTFEEEFSISIDKFIGNRTSVQ